MNWPCASKESVNPEPGSNPISAVTLRQATRTDAPALLRLIVALAQFEKLTPPDEAAQRRLVEHGFGPKPRFEAWLAVWDGLSEPVAYSLFFETYSSFEAAPTLYLEDIFVLPDFRGRGIGSALLRHCIQTAHARGCARMEWTCLDWNTRAQTVYDGLGARRLSEWVLYRLRREGMETALAPGNETLKPLDRSH
jgi:GNAT superfamily N-acetyltransferase